MRFGFLGAIFVAVLLASCGGGGGGGDGGGGQLYVSVNYSSTPVNLFSDSTVMPNLSGFEGHAARCSLVSDSPPPGMSVRGDCAIVGRPTQAGLFSFTLRVGASGASNTVDTLASVRVVGPTVMYPNRAAYLGSLAVGAPTNDSPSVSGWTPPLGVVLNWSYALKSGSLPPGLSLDAASGAIVGTTTAAGAYSATIQAVLSTQYGTYQPNISTYMANVSVPSFGYLNVGGTGTGQYFHTAYISQPFVAQPWNGPSAPDGSTLSGFSLGGAALPPGLSLDATTGYITGVPTTPAFGQTIPVTASITSGTVTNSTQAMFGIEVAYPMYVRYASSATGSVGALLTLSPMTVHVSPLPAVSAAFLYVPRAQACDLPPGVILDPATGVASGTPTARGSFSCFVDVSVTNNGMTWATGAQIYVVVN